MKSTYKGIKRAHKKVSGAFEFWQNIKREYRGRRIPAGTRAPGSAITKRKKDTQ